MRKLAWFLLAPGFFAWPGVVPAQAPAPLGPQVKAILQTHCAGCHGGGKAAKGGFGFVLDRDQLVGRLLVAPGKAHLSELLLRVEKGEMPPESRKERPSAAEVQLLKRWIEAGAPAFEMQMKTFKVLSDKEVASAILDDLEKLDPRARRFTRYLTLHHLVLAGRSERDLQTATEATNKVLNSLSWHPRISLADTLADGTILRIDLRAYKWNAALWDKVVALYPYRIDVGTEDARTIVKRTGSELPALRADWFVANASHPPLYHELLQLPTSDRGLERLLNVDVPGDIQEDNVLRAGFNDSGVSKNNRLLERHAAAFGALWRSYDFEKNTGRQNLLDHPLGPNTGATSFQPSGGEMIFHLPNGLQGYLLMDALGRRIDKAPGEIVSDPRRPDQRVETGLSCMSCHARGLLPKADQLRGHVEKNAQVFGKEVVAAVRALHPRKTAFQAQIEEDNIRYLKAIEKFGLRDPDQEPVNLVTGRFEATLDGKSAAAELGLTPAEFGSLLKQDRELSRIFGGVLVAGGTVQRQVFEEKFPELTRQLTALNVANAKPAGEAKTAFTGHTGTVNAVAFSHDGKRIASGSDDKTVRIWDLEGKQLACLQGDSGEVYTVAFSRDGKYLLSGGRDRLLRLWDLAAWKQVRVFQGSTESIRAVAFSSDGKRAVSGGDDRSLRIWDIASAEEIRTLTGHAQGVTSVAWSSEGKHMLSGSRDGTARYWDLQRGTAVARFEGHADAVFAVALMPDGKSAVSGSNDKTVRVWDLATGNELHCFKGHDNAVIGLHVLSDSVVLSSSSQHRNIDRTWRRWDLSSRKEVGSLTAGADFSFGCAAFSPDGRQILVGGPSGFMRLWRW